MLALCVCVCLNPAIQSSLKVLHCHLFNECLVVRERLYIFVFVTDQIQIIGHTDTCVETSPFCHEKSQLTIHQQNTIPEVLS